MGVSYADLSRNFSIIEHYLKQSQYHDDGETGLGPTVATFSLGGNASMKFRMKDRYYKGHSKTGQVYPNDPVLPGCFMEKDRHDLLQQKETLSAYDYSVLLSELITQHKSKKASEILHLELAHGDFVVMHGADMQRYFEVSTTPLDYTSVDACTKNDLSTAYHLLGFSALL